MSQSGDPNFFLKVPYKKFPLRVIPKIRGRTEERHQGRKGIESGDNWPGELKKTSRRKEEKRKRIGDESVKKCVKNRNQDCVFYVLKLHSILPAEAVGTLVCGVACSPLSFSSNHIPFQLGFSNMIGPFGPP